jgi:hypothetical protein
MFWRLHRNASTEVYATRMPDLTTKPIPGLFGEYFAVVAKADPASFIAVGITPAYAWATARDKLGIDGKQLEAGYEIVRISEDQFRAFAKE